MCAAHLFFFYAPLSLNAFFFIVLSAQREGSDGHRGGIWTRRCVASDRVSTQNLTIYCSSQPQSRSSRQLTLSVTLEIYVVYLYLVWAGGGSDGSLKANKKSRGFGPIRINISLEETSLNSITAPCRGFIDWPLWLYWLDQSQRQRYDDVWVPMDAGLPLSISADQNRPEQIFRSERKTSPTTAD